MEAEYRTYGYEKEEGTENENINFLYIHADCILTAHALSLTNECS